MIIVLAVVGMLISAIIPLFLNVLTANKSAEYYSQAYKLADSRIEELRSLSFESIDSEAGIESTSLLPDGSIETSVTNVIKGVPEDGIREITITIDWNFKSEKSYTTSTLISEGGIGR